MPPTPPTPPAPRPPTEPPIPTPSPSASPTAVCSVVVNMGLCANFTANQEPIEGCECYNYCNGVFNGCCGYFEGEECEQDCVGVVASGCELNEPTMQPTTASPTIIPVPTVSGQTKRVTTLRFTRRITSLAKLATEWKTWAHC
jgi:hypothetical protein